MTKPTLSVVLATTEAWPDLATCLAVLEPQAERTGAEIIVGDGDGSGLPQKYTSDPGRVVWIRKPGASVFELRALCVMAAKADIIATTEDHCIVDPDWCERLLAAHAAHPEALAVAGAVTNGSTTSRADWANFLHTFGAFTPPVDPGQKVRWPVNANLSYKRAAFPGGALEPGWMELQLNGRLVREHKVVVDDRIRVAHVQSHGFLGTFAAHFHNGRATAGLHPIRLSRRQLPWRLYRLTMQTLRNKPELEAVIRSCKPFIAALSTCHALGETVGILFGPGKSAERLR
jgi:hypothetical protein